MLIELQRGCIMNTRSIRTCFFVFGLMLNDYCHAPISLSQEIANPYKFLSKVPLDYAAGDGICRSYGCRSRAKPKEDELKKCVEKTECENCRDQRIIDNELNQCQFHIKSTLRNSILIASTGKIPTFIPTFDNAEFNVMSCAFDSYRLDNLWEIYKTTSQKPKDVGIPNIVVLHLSIVARLPSKHTVMVSVSYEPEYFIREKSYVQCAERTQKWKFSAPNPNTILTFAIPVYGIFDTSKLIINTECTGKECEEHLSICGFLYCNRQNSLMTRRNHIIQHWPQKPSNEATFTSGNGANIPQLKNQPVGSSANTNGEDDSTNPDDESQPNNEKDEEKQQEEKEQEEEEQEEKEQEEKEQEEKEQEEKEQEEEEQEEDKSKAVDSKRKNTRTTVNSNPAVTKKSAVRNTAEIGEDAPPNLVSQKSVPRLQNSAEQNQKPPAGVPNARNEHHGYPAYPPNQVYQSIPRSYVQQLYPPHFYPQQYDPQQYNPQQYNPQQYNPQQYNPQQYNPQQYNPQQYNPQQYNPQQYNPQQYAGTGSYSNNGMSIERGNDSYNRYAMSRFSRGLLGLRKPEDATKKANWSAIRSYQIPIVV